ncbi:MAG TPA: bifunctional hydroxymethylpyrimidine kinase/phosphomethylpyrimidine kinase [Methanomassiliicoccales archaeon]|jgi:hydroxymethylpyrimidine/phosphomethylpyrimidine kinase
MPTVLTIAGTDSIGGAGVAADLKAFASMDLHGCCVITAVTSQNTQGVSNILPVPVKDVASQLNAVFDDLKIDAVKTGMIYSSEIAEVVRRKLRKEGVPLVVDPVLCAGVGSPLFREDLKGALLGKLFPLATLVTPNRPEAEELTSSKITEQSGAEDACRTIISCGASSVLLKGGHFEGPMASDLLLHEDQFTEFTSPRLPIKVHGSGCTLSSYIAGHLAMGCDVRRAVAGSKRRVQDAIAMSSSLGKGMAIINPMATKQKEAMRYPRMETLRNAMMRLEQHLPPSFIPENGIDFVYSLPNPQDFHEICGFEGREQCSNVVFGSSGWISRMIMSVNIEHPELLSGIEIRHSKWNEQFLLDRRIVKTIACFEDSGDVLLTVMEGTEHPSKQLGLSSGSLFKSDGMGREPRIGLLGKDPDEIIKMIGPCLDG